MLATAVEAVRKEEIPDNCEDLDEQADHLYGLKPRDKLSKEAIYMPIGSINSLELVHGGSNRFSLCRRLGLESSGGSLAGI